LILATSKRKGPGSRNSGGTVACPRPCRHPDADGARRSADRRRRIEQIKKEIAAGTYETEGKLRIALTRLIDDVIARKAEDDG
jgi:hypothetical protein